MQSTLTEAPSLLHTVYNVTTSMITGPGVQEKFIHYGANLGICSLETETASDIPVHVRKMRMFFCMYALNQSYPKGLE